MFYVHSAEYLNNNDILCTILSINKMYEIGIESLRSKILSSFQNLFPQK